MHYLYLLKTYYIAKNREHPNCAVSKNTYNCLMTFLRHNQKKYRLIRVNNNDP